METLTSYLPDNIVLEILQSLSVKSLLRFSCVAKLWNSLIFSHEFSRKHIQYLKRHSSFHHRIMLSIILGTMNFSLCHAALNEPMVRVFDNTNHFFLRRSFVASCDGLICMAVSESEGYSYPLEYIILWNPTIQKIKRLTGFGVEKEYSVMLLFGFGYDESRDDYKVVGFYFSTMDDFDVLVKIYSMKTSELKTIKNHKGRWLDRRPPTFANGKLHWFVQFKSGECDIAYLDLATEEYGTLEKPDNVKLTNPGAWNIICKSIIMPLSGGRLYVSNKSDISRYAWFVEPGYGDRKTNWTQVLMSYVGFGYEKYFTYSIPLFVFDNGEIVFFYKKKIVIVNPKDRSVRHPRLSDAHDFRRGIAYVESLVSPCSRSVIMS